MDTDTLSDAAQDVTAAKEPGDYRKGDILPTGVKIASILAQSRTVLVFTTDSGALSHLVKNKWKVSDYANNVHRFTELLELIPKDLGREERERLREELGLQLFAALRAEDGRTAAEHFDAVERNIRQAPVAVREHRHLRFVGWTIGYGITTVVLLSLAFLAAKYLLGIEPVSVVMAIGGTFGACISVLQRERTTDVTCLQERQAVPLFSAVSVTLGALAGFACYWAMRGNVILGVLDEAPAAMFIVCVLAGVSERYLNRICRRPQPRA